MHIAKAFQEKQTNNVKFSTKSSDGPMRCIGPSQNLGTKSNDGPMDTGPQQNFYAVHDVGHNDNPGALEPADKTNIGMLFNTKSSTIYVFREYSTGASFSKPTKISSAKLCLFCNFDFFNQLDQDQFDRGNLKFMKSCRAKNGPENGAILEMNSTQFHTLNNLSSLSSAFNEHCGNRIVVSSSMNNKNEHSPSRKEKKCFRKRKNFLSNIDFLKWNAAIFSFARSASFVFYVILKSQIKS
uniref:Uncharacterized protein n=1 Tax=Romanomermis culicivorax TaxID=13658 RepID=A0A915HN64_ROMCU